MSGVASSGGGGGAGGEMLGGLWGIRIAVYALAAQRALPADTIIGVSYFRDNYPTEFGRFDRGLVSTIRVAAGEPWVDFVEVAQSSPKPINFVMTGTLLTPLSAPSLRCRRLNPLP